MPLLQIILVGNAVSTSHLHFGSNLIFVQLNVQYNGKLVGRKEHILPKLLAGDRQCRKICKIIDNPFTTPILAPKTTPENMPTVL